jgi:hypothetical protein
MKKYNSFYEFVKEHASTSERNIFKYITKEDVYLGSLYKKPIEEVDGLCLDLININCDTIILINDKHDNGKISCLGHIKRLKNGESLLENLFEINGIIYRLKFFDQALNRYSNSVQNTGYTCFEAI